jgi:hypothetical protein
MKTKTCIRCGTELDFVECADCEGTGQTTFLFLFDHDCDSCGGKGGWMRCPNLLSHLQTNQPPAAAAARSPKRRQTLTQEELERARALWWAQSPNNPMNPNSPLNPQNPRNPMNPRNPANIMNPNHPLNPMRRR